MTGATRFTSMLICGLMLAGCQQSTRGNSGAGGAAGAGAGGHSGGAGAGGGSCAPAAETCNGMDDDCDGLVDEGPLCIVNGCMIPVSECADGKARACTTADLQPEVCGNGLDDNCDGKMDCADPTCAMPWQFGLYPGTRYEAWQFPSGRVALLQTNDRVDQPEFSFALQWLDPVSNARDKEVLLYSGSNVDESKLYLLDADTLNFLWRRGGESNGRLFFQSLEKNALTQPQIIQPPGYVPESMTGFTGAPADHGFWVGVNGSTTSRTPDSVSVARFDGKGNPLTGWVAMPDGTQLRLEGGIAGDDLGGLLFGPASGANTVPVLALGPDAHSNGSPQTLNLPAGSRGFRTMWNGDGAVVFSFSPTAINVCQVGRNGEPGSWNTLVSDPTNAGLSVASATVLVQRIAQGIVLPYTREVAGVPKVGAVVVDPTSLTSKYNLEVTVPFMADQRADLVGVYSAGPDPVMVYDNSSNSYAVDMACSPLGGCWTKSPGIDPWPQP